MKNNFIIATHNIHKIKEIETILNFYRQHGEGYRKKLPQQTFPPESTVSYEENAKEYIRRFLYGWESLPVWMNPLDFFGNPKRTGKRDFISEL